jgi:glucans biosynthesis protein
LLAALAAPGLLSAGRPLRAQRLGPAEGVTFGSDTVATMARDLATTMARDLATRPHAPARNPLPQALERLSYDGYRGIRYRAERALWAEGDLPFRLQPHHRGFLFKDRVSIFEVADGRARPLPYVPDDFTFEGVEAPPADADLGFAGFRLLHPLNRGDHFDEVCSFLGASYFRAVGRGHVYGLSARGLAIRTAHAQGEEFPAFTAFWIERPSPGATAVTVHALLESPSVTGAYSFVIAPGEATVMGVDAQLFPRADLPHIGIAPGTSMFFFGPNDPATKPDYRSAVHDSDGLMTRSGRGEQIWRPLCNPRTLQVSGFQDQAPRGFGLMQRNRRFDAFQDLEAMYHRRPSLWVEPLDDWGAGEVRLIEIPTPSEIHDNIVAAWSPREPLRAGQPTRLRYNLHWVGSGPPGPPHLTFATTRIGAGAQEGTLHVVLDTARAMRTGGTLEPLVEADAGAIANVALRDNVETGGFRLAFDLKPGVSRVIELRARLVDGDAPASETWMYRWTA